MDTIKRTLTLGLMLWLALTIQAQMESQLTYRRYTIQDGLPQMQAERLWQDSRGYIYIGTLSGFVRFDGQAFTPFLKGRRVNIVGFAEVDDEVRAFGFFQQWTVGYDDIAQQPLDPQGHWLLNNLNAGSLPDGYVLLEDSLEQNRRLCRLTRQGFVPLLRGQLFDAMTPDRKVFVDARHLFIPTEKGLYRVDWREKSAKRATRLTAKGDVYTLLRTDSDLLAFASNGIYKIEGKEMSRIAPADWKAASYGLTVRQLHSGHLAIADEHTVYLYDGATVRQIFTGINLIRDLLVDRWDRLWVATYQGVYCFFNRCFTNHRLTDESDIVRAVATSGDRLVMGTLNGKLLLSTNSRAECVSDAPDQFYAPSAVAIGSNVYIPGNGDIVCMADTTPRWLQLPRDRYYFVASAWQRLIAGSRNSIFAYHPDTGILDTLTTAIRHPWCGAADGNGLLWIGASSGLYSITRDRQVDKVPYGRQKLVVSTLVADPRGNIFFASADSVFVVKDRRVEPLNPQMPQLAGHEVRSLHVSPKGFLVVAVIDGLFVARIDDRLQVSDLRFYNHQNGFTLTEPLKAQMAETADGTIWLPGVEQMASFRPAALLDYHEEDTYIAPPLSWWQHWWVWLLGLLCIALTVWTTARWYEQQRSQRRMVRLQREKLQRDQQIEAIRQKAIEDEPARLAEDIVRLTEKPADTRLTLRTASGTIVVEVRDIAYFKGDGNYSQIVSFHGSDTVLCGLGTLSKTLDPETFVRADRSTIVNVHNISRLQPRQRICVFRSANGEEVETTLLAPAFKRLQAYL